MEREELLYALNEAIEERQLNTSDQDVTIVETAINILNEDADTLASYNESEQLTILEAAVEVLTEADRLAKERKKRYYEANKEYDDLEAQQDKLTDNYSKYKSHIGGLSLFEKKYRDFDIKRDDAKIKREKNAPDNRFFKKDNMAFPSKTFRSTLVPDIYLSDGEVLYYLGSKSANDEVKYSFGICMQSGKSVTKYILTDGINGIRIEDGQGNPCINEEIRKKLIKFVKNELINKRTRADIRKNPSHKSTQHESALAIIFGSSLNESSNEKKN